MNEKEVLKKLLKGEIKLYEVDKYLSADKATKVRRKFIEEVTGTKLEHVSKYTIDMENALRKTLKIV